MGWNIRRSCILAGSAVFLCAGGARAAEPATAPAQTQPTTAPTDAAFGAHVRLSDFYAREGDFTDAAKELEAAMKLSPTNKPLRIRLAKLYMAANPPDWKKFDDLLHECETDDRLKSDAVWLYMEAAGLSERGEMSSAIDKIQQAKVVAPQDESVEAGYIDLLIKAKRYTDAVQEIDRAMPTSKRPWWLHEKRGEALAYHGEQDQAKKEFEQALDIVDAAGRRDFAADIIYDMAVHLDPDAALAALQPRIGVDPGWRLLAARLDVMKKDYAAGLKLAEAVTDDPLATASQHLTATEQVAECAVQVGSFEKAKAAYLAWLAQQPSNLTALNNLACLLNDNLKQPAQALKYAEAAYQDAFRFETPLRPIVTDTYGWVQVCCGGEQAKKGTAILEQLVQDRGQFLDARYHLGEAYFKAGDTQRAIKEFSSAMDVIKDDQGKQIVVSDTMQKKIQQAMHQAKEADINANANVP